MDRPPTVDARSPKLALSADGRTMLLAEVGGNEGKGGTIRAFRRSRGRWVRQGPPLAPEGLGPGRWSYPRLALSADGRTALIADSWRQRDAATTAAWVFTRSGSSWTQSGPRLTPPRSRDLSDFGTDVALSGDGTFAVVTDASFDTVWSFARSGTTWTRQERGLSVDVDEGSAVSDVALSADGRVLAVGSDKNAVLVFERAGGAWVQADRLVASEMGCEHYGFGVSIALSADGSTVLVGDWNASGCEKEYRRWDELSNRGAGWVFTRAGDRWELQAELVPSTSRLDTAQTVALSADGGTALIGAGGDLVSGQQPGCPAYYSGIAVAFSRTGTIWTEQAKLNECSATGRVLWRPVALSADARTALVGGILSGPPYYYRSARPAVWTFSTAAECLVGARSAALRGDRTLRMGAGCDQDARATLRGVARWGRTTARLRPVHAALSAYSPRTLRLRLPRRAVVALRRGVKLTVAVTLAAANLNGTGYATTRVTGLRPPP